MKEWVQLILNGKRQWLYLNKASVNHNEWWDNNQNIKRPSTGK